MYRANDGRSFVDYKVCINDIRYAIVSDSTQDFFEQALNERIDELVEEGFVVVEVNYNLREGEYIGVIQYVDESNVYYYKEKKEEVE